jgi:hypothetical protein
MNKFYNAKDIRTGMNIPANLLPSKLLFESDSNKTHEVNQYGPVYDLVIAALLCLNRSPIRVLEIGTSFYGEALAHVFSDVPYIEKFVGIDIKIPVTPLGSNGIFIHGDAYQKETLDLVRPHAPFHLLIDDGTHRMDHQQFFFEHYSQFCAVPGVIWCEDIQDSQVEARLKSIDDPRINVVKVPSVKPDDDKHRNAFLIFNLSEQIHIKDRFEWFYAALDTEQKRIENLRDKKEWDALDKSLLKGIYEFHSGVRNPLVVEWYFAIRKERDRLRSDKSETEQTYEYFCFKHVIAGSANASESEFVAKWFKNLKKGK